MFPRILGRVVEWVKAHKQFGLQFEERGSSTWVFVRTWRRDSFYRVTVGVIDRYHGDASSELVILGQFLSAIGSGALWSQFLGGHRLSWNATKSIWGADAFADCWTIQFLTSSCSNAAYKQTASTVFGTLDPFSMTEFIVTRLQGAEHCDWMHSRQALRRSIDTGDLSLPGLIDVVSNIIGVWPLIVSYLEETGEKDSDDSLVVWFSSFSFVLSMTATAYFQFHV